MHSSRIHRKRQPGLSVMSITVNVNFQHILNVDSHFILENPAIGSILIDAKE